MDLQEFPTVEAWTAESVKWLTDCIREDIKAHGQCVLGLSGGKTPKVVLQELAKAQGIDWHHVLLFLVDERCIAATDPESNQHLLEEVLLSHLEVKPRVIVPDTTLEPEACAKDYDAKLKTFLANNEADILVLGMGTDGHIASLFPPLGEECFGSDTVVHTTTDKFPVHDRISATLPVLSGSKRQLLLLQGKEKQATLQQMTSDAENPKRWPLQAIEKLGKLRVHLVY